MAGSKNSKLAELIESFREVEDPAQAAPVVGDVDATKLLAAWAYYPPPDWEPVGKPPASPPSARWAWLWQSCAIDTDDLAEAAGISTHVVEAKLRVLLNSRLIYPDGTISKPARGLLHAYISKHVPKARRT